MSELELDWLALRASSCQRIAEVGSWKGRSTIALAENCKGMVFAVDTWQGSKEHSPEEIGPDGALLREFRNNTDDLPVVAVEMPSVRAAELFQKSGLDFDMIFIDASHDYSSVRADLLAWGPLLKTDGVLCGHDLNWTGVAQAVAEVIGNVKNPVDAIWFK